MVFKALRELRVAEYRFHEANFSLFSKLVNRIPWEANVCIKVALKGVRLLSTALCKCRNRENCICSKGVVQPAKEIMVKLWCKKRAHGKWN